MRVIPVVVGALGMTSKHLKNWLEKINIKSSIELLQKATLLGTAKILRPKAAGCGLLSREKNRFFNLATEMNDNNIIIIIIIP